MHKEEINPPAPGYSPLWAVRIGNGVWMAVPHHELYELFAVYVAEGGSAGTSFTATALGMTAPDPVDTPPEFEPIESRLAQWTRVPEVQA